MNLIKWLISILVSLILGSALIGVVLLLMFVGPALAMITTALVVVFVIALEIKEYLDNKT